MENNTRIVVNTILDACFKRGITPRPMKLQKLLYFSYGKCLEDTKGKIKLIDEGFEAWPYGCVVPNVYYAFKHFGYRGIDSLSPSIDGKCYILNNQDLSNSQKINSIIVTVEHYGKWSGMDLSDYNHTKKNSAWLVTKKLNETKIKEEHIMQEFVDKQEE